VTATSITLTAIAGAEYRRGENGAWQDAATFSGLVAGTGYTFYARLKETASLAASSASPASATITTGALATLNITYGLSDGDEGLQLSGGTYNAITKMVAITLSRSGNGYPKKVFLDSAEGSDIADTWWDYAVSNDTFYTFDSAGKGNGHHYFTLEVWKDAPYPDGVPYSVTFDITITD
jgi:hypothetical protein